jgi:hypothetical protein
VAATQDDAYITLRYAGNLARGEGLVFNPGEFVEGYSNFLYTLLLAAFIRLDSHPMVAAKAIGLVSGCAAILGTWKLASRLPEASKAAWLAPLLLAISPAFAAWSVLGLETVFYSLLILLAAQSAMSGPLGPRSAAVSGLLFALVALTHPEGALFFVATVVFLLVKGRAREWIPGLASFALVFGGFLVWRVWYYGDLLPNTYYAKSGLGLLAIVRGAKYLFEFFKSYGGPVVPFLALVPLFWGPPSSAVQYLACLAAAYLGFVIWVGGDNFAEFRFIVPILPILYLLAAEGAVRGVRELRNRRSAWNRRRAAPLAALAAFTAAFMLAPVVYSFAPQLRGLAADAPLTDANQLVTIGEWLRGFAPADSSIAVGEAGAIPYVTGWRTLDGFGLSDRDIARAPRVPNAVGVRKKSPAFVIARLLDWQPDFVEFYGVPGFDTVLGPNDNLLWNALLAAGYTPVPPYDRLSGFVVLARPGIAARFVPAGGTSGVEP